MYGLGIAQAVLTPLVGKIVSMTSSNRSIARCKFSAVADPLVVTVVKADGTPYSPTIEYSIPLADITFAQEYGSGGGWAGQQAIAAEAAAAGTTNWLMWGGIAVVGAIILNKMGVFKGIKKALR